MDLDDLRWRLESRITQLAEEVVNANNAIGERLLPGMVNLMMTLHGWTADSGANWQGDLHDLANEQQLLECVQNFRLMLKQLDDVSANAEASLQIIRDKQPPKETKKP